MKMTNYLLSLFVFLAVSAAARAQNESGVDSTGLPGDNFSLQGALQMFQNASSPEDFEKMINTEGNHVNNLDLNGDGDIDYIRVVDRPGSNAHAFVLQVAVSETENQDIAVIELEKTGDTTAILQIVGDEDIYGEQVIAEPGEGDDGAFNSDNNNSNASGPHAGYMDNNMRIVINVWFWPSVRFVYAPAYTVWVSPWRWHLHPLWWHPWRPLAWHAFHPFHLGYRRSFGIVHTHRVIRAHAIYTPFRATSVAVRTRHATSVNNFRVTHSRTSVTGPRGNTTTVRKTTVTGPKGNKATKVKVRRH